MMKAPSINGTQRCALLLCLLLPLQCGAARFVEISAEIELLARASWQTNAEASAKPRTISVHCIAGANSWRIENDWVSGGVNRWFFDGTNVYESIQVTKPLPPETLERMKKAGGPAPAPFDVSKSHLTINIWPSPDGHPLADQSVNLPWLAFCSGTYLKREGRLIPLPMDILHHTPDRYAYTDQTETFNDAIGLPRSVDLYLSRKLYLSSVEDFYKGWGTRYLPWMRAAVTNLQEGASMFHYSVTATTNFLSWTFPLRFEFSQKGRPFIQNGDWSWSGVGTLKAIHEVAAPTNLFNPAVQQTIVDWRFNDEASGMNANIYTWSNAVVPRTNEPALQATFQRRVESARRHKEADE